MLFCLEPVSNLSENRAFVYLTGLLHGAAWHLHSVLGKEVIQNLHFHALLMTNRASDHVYCCAQTKNISHCNMDMTIALLQ